MPDMIIFGAGASFGSDILNVPPLGSDLIEELISFQPHTWGKIESSLIRLLKEDFEKGMEKLSQKHPHLMAPLQRAMAEFFFRFAPGPDNLYRTLARRIRQSGWDGVLATFNYDRLLELSLIFEGLQPVAGKPLTPNHIEVCLPHGCCHLFCESVVDSAPAISFNGATAGTQGPVRPVLEPDEFIGHISNGRFLPVINYFESVKSTASGVNFINAQRNRFKEVVLSCSKIAIIGLKVRPRDKHIWGPLALTSAGLIYCSRETAAKRFKSWAKKWRLGRDKVFDGTFDEHFDDICHELDVDSGVLLAASEAKTKAEVEEKTEAEKRTKVEAEESVKSCAEQTETVKAEAAEMTTKFEAEAAETIARIKSESEESIRVYADSMAEPDARFTAATEERASTYVAVAEKGEEKPKGEIGENAKAETESRHRFEAEETARSEAEARVKAEEAQAEAEKKVKACVKVLARAEEKLTKVKEEAEKRLKAETEERLRVEAEAAEEIAKVKAEAEEKARTYARAIARVKAEAEEWARAYADMIARVRPEVEEAIEETNYPQRLSLRQWFLNGLRADSAVAVIVLCLLLSVALSILAISGYFVYAILRAFP